MTNVLLVLENNPFASGGIERHCRNIIDIFKNDNSISISALSKDEIPYKYFKLINKIIFNKKDLKKAISESKCDVVHIHGFASLIVPQTIQVAHRLKKKIVYTAHYHPFYTLTNPFLGKLFFMFLVQMHLKKVDVIITINKEDTNFFRRYNRNIVQIPNWLTGIPLLSANRQENTILFVGRNAPNKGIEYLNEIPQGKYHIHCVTDSAEGLRSDIIIHKNLTDKELSALYAGSSLLVAPSKYEAFSYVVLEALERGTPVLISDKVRIADHMTGVNGITLFKYGNKLDFVNQLERAMKNSVDVEKVKSIFSPIVIKEALSTIYTSGK